MSTRPDNRGSTVTFNRFQFKQIGIFLFNALRLKMDGKTSQIRRLRLLKYTCLLLIVIERHYYLDPRALLRMQMVERAQITEYAYFLVNYGIFSINHI